MEGKENLLTQAISSLISETTRLFTPEQLLTVADISIEELDKVKDTFGNKADEIVKYFSDIRKKEGATNGK